MIERLARKLARMAEKGYEFESRESIKRFMSKMGFSETSVDRVYLEFKNELSRDTFEATNLSERVLLLPHCMMDTDHCEAERIGMGYECGKCGRCDLEGLTVLAEEFGYDHYIVPGGSMVRKIVEDMDYEVAIGVACFPELIDANRYMEKNGMKMLMAELNEDGCFMTSVHVPEVERLMRMGLKGEAEPEPLDLEEHVGEGVDLMMLDEEFRED